MNLKEKLDKLLLRVEKPARYIGGELHSVKKDPSTVKTRFAFCFPDTYEIGMSYMGLQIIYHVLNKEESIFCERVFAPALDMEEEMRKEDLPLFTLETKTPLKEMDLLGFTLQYELSFTNILNMLDLSGVPLKSEERGEGSPFIAAGGPCAFNPEPLADFIDFFMLGDGEEVLPEVCRIHSAWKESGKGRRAFLETVSQVAGVYVPSFYDAHYDDQTGYFSGLSKNWDGAPERVEKRILADIENEDFPRNPIVPLIEVVHDRSVIEIFRGCTRGCRFCQAGMIYRPVRERSAAKIREIAESQIKSTGHDEISILSLSTSDHSEIEPLVTDLMEMCRQNNVSMSLPSLRLDSFSFRVLEEIQQYKKTGLTFAPEAGTQRLRDVINKNIREEDIWNAVEKAVELGWTSIKLYFMIGLPTESYEDLDGIAETARRIMDIAYKVSGKKGRFNVTVSVSNFVPKAHTPFQWFAQNTKEEFSEKHLYLKEKIAKIKGVQFNYHGADVSRMEAVFARGDRRTGKVLLAAWKKGCKFDGWREYFQYENWLSAFRESGMDPDLYTLRTFAAEEALPWDHLSCGVSKAFLLSEWEKALAEAVTDDCRKGCTGCGVNENVRCEREGTL